MKEMPLAFPSHIANRISSRLIYFIFWIVLPSVYGVLSSLLALHWFSVQLFKTSVLLNGYLVLLFAR